MAWRKQRRDYSTPPNPTMELSPATGNIVVVALRLGLRFAMSFHSNKPSLVLHRPALSAFCFRISFHTGTLSCAHSTSRSLSHTHNPATKTNKASCSKTHPLIHSSTATTSLASSRVGWDGFQLSGRKCNTIGKSTRKRNLDDEHALRPSSGAGVVHPALSVYVFGSSLCILYLLFTILERKRLVHTFPHCGSPVPFALRLTALYTAIG